jgi:hypothetical protein
MYAVFIAARGSTSPALIGNRLTLGKAEPLAVSPC